MLDLKRIFLPLIVLLLASCQSQPRLEIFRQNLNTLEFQEKSMKILTLYDNYTTSPDLKTDWGFSALISVDDYNLLFDTGTDGKILFGNMEKLEVDHNDINEIMISHDHHDHYGGLADFLIQNNQVKVYTLSSFNQTKKIIQSAGAKIIEIDQPFNIKEKIYTTGSLGSVIKEQSLVLEAGQGLVIITGCAHPGIIEIIKTVKNQFPGKQIYLVIGGFHLYEADSSEIKKIVQEFKNLGVQKVAPCHCTGDEAIELFRKIYQDNFIQNGVGKLIEI